MAPRLLVISGCLAVVVACSHSSSSSSNGAAPLAPSAMPAAPTNTAPMAVHAVQGRQNVLVNMLDACDPDTFNAAVEPGTCVRSGGVKFDQFVAELTRNGFIGAWHFAPPNANVRVGQTFLAVNKGGEVHTFTEVEQFAGGIVPFLNQLAHVPNVAPECAALVPGSDDFVAPGGTYEEDVEEPGTLKFQCCIHPWMRLEARSSDR